MESSQHLRFAARRASKGVEVHVSAWKLSTLSVVVRLDTYTDFLSVLATAASQTSGSSDTMPPSASEKVSALLNRRATTGIFG